MYAESDYDGAVYFCKYEGDYGTRIALALAYEYRGLRFKVEVFNECLTIDFPFGRYYLE